MILPEDTEVPQTANEGFLLFVLIGINLLSVGSP